MERDVRGDDINVDLLPMTLHDMVDSSVGAIHDIDLRRTLLSQILVVGGPAKTKGFVDEFEDRFSDRRPVFVNGV